MSSGQSNGGSGSSGNGSDDVVHHGTPGDDHLVGISVHDVVDLSTESVRGSIFSASGAETVHRHGGQTDTYTGIADVKFADGRMVLDPNDPAAQVLRLYQAALGRTPDQSGLNYWIDQLERGGRLGDLGEAFLRSPEFQARVGTATDDGSYVDKLYQNVLGRSGDAAGRSYWMDQLHGGASRRDVLASFSESAENKGLTHSKVTAGIWDRSESAEQVARLYDTVLGRLPDASGLAYWSGKIDDGSMKVEDVASSLSGSGEFATRYGGLSSHDFVEALYRNALGRTAAAGESDGWTRSLESGAASRAGVALGFSESPEHMSRTAASFASDDPSSYGIKTAG